MRLQRGAHVDLTDDGRVLGKDVDEAFFTELHQRVAHRRLAQTIAVCELSAREHRARCQFE